MKIKTSLLNSHLIAPCGMNCGICIGHMREKNKCDGCNSNSKNKPKYCITCSIKNCAELKKANSRFCFACDKYPCRRLKDLDKRYRTRYKMSMLENLETIKESGIKYFVNQEKNRWECSNCKSIICVHKEQCINCGQLRTEFTS